MAIGGSLDGERRRSELVALAQGADGVSIEGAAARFGVSAMTIRRDLADLEVEGLLRRVRSSEDRRVVNIELTPDGLAAAAQIPVILSRVQNNALRGFSETEWRSLQDFLQRIFTNVQAAPQGEDTP